MECWVLEYGMLGIGIWNVGYWNMECWVLEYGMLGIKFQNPHKY